LGKKYAEQQAHEYLKGAIFRLIAGSGGTTAAGIKEALRVQDVEELYSCLEEMEGDGLINFDSDAGLWKAA
jgi:hypothetical protein